MAESQLIKFENDFSMHYQENWKHWTLTDQCHNDLEVIYIVNGIIEITINGKSYTAGAQTMIFINNLEPHHYTILEYPYCRHVLIFKQNFLGALANEPVLASIFNYRPKNFSHIIQLTPEQAPAILQLFYKLHDEYRDKVPFWERAVKTHICQLVIYLYRISEISFPLSELNHTIGNKVIVDIQSYIDEHYMEDINLKDISGMFHTNMYYLCHLFKDITGSTFKNHLIQRRVSYAKDLLSYTEKDVSEIATETGFGSVNHFIRTFKKTVSITPYQYRKNFLRNSKAY
jgi:AraC-like DNA-binding protein